MRLPARCLFTCTAATPEAVSFSLVQTKNCLAVAVNQLQLESMTYLIGKV